MKRTDNCLKKMTYRIWDPKILNKLNELKDETGMSYNDIITDFIMKGNIIIDNSKSEHNELLRLVVYHLSRIGINLNRLTKLLNANVYVKDEYIKKLLASSILELSLLRQEVLKNK